MLNLQENPQRASGLLHGTLAGIRGVVAGAHRLLRATFGARVRANRTAPATHLGVPQTLLSCATMDVVA